MPRAESFVGMGTGAGGGNHLIVRDSMQDSLRMLWCRGAHLFFRDCSLHEPPPHPLT